MSREGAVDLGSVGGVDEYDKNTLDDTQRTHKKLKNRTIELCDSLNLPFPFVRKTQHPSICLMYFA